MALTCPFCNYVTSQADDTKLAANAVAYHVETVHPENDGEESPFLLKPNTPTGTLLSSGSRNNSRDHRDRDISDPSNGQGVDEDGNEYVECDLGCGEKILRSDLEEHCALHEFEDKPLDEHDCREQKYRLLSDKLSGGHTRNKVLRSKTKSSGHDKKSLGGVILSKSHRRPREPSEAASIEPGQRLGKNELGPYAFEERMPSWLYKMIERGPAVTWINQIGSDGQVQRVERVANETSGLIPYLSRLCGRDRTVSKAWLCSAGVRHIFKVPREGGFCGYRNIQMMVSWMQHHQHPGHEHFPGATPNILYLQDLIENAWDKGFNTCGRAETGGIRGTRKFIGTPEAQVLFQSLNIKCDTRAFSRSKGGKSDEAIHIRLLQFVMVYFSQGVQDPSDKVYETNLPPYIFSIHVTP